LLEFLFLGLDKERSLQKRGGYTDELLARILDAAARIKKREDQLRRTTRDLRNELQNALRLTVGFSNIYREL
jgi:hypothetical protein